jgi:hypothetical protein
MIGIIESEATNFQRLGTGFVSMQTPLFLINQAEPPVLVRAQTFAPRHGRHAHERRSMSDAAGYRENAELCAAFAERSRSPKDRAAWLLMSSAWLELALVREYAARLTPAR